jgi:heme/copper-type cytochrome/quinol oxidase subunit 2
MKTLRVTERNGMYKEFAVEVVVWLIPVVILLGLAILVTSTA